MEAEDLAAALVGLPVFAGLNERELGRVVEAARRRKLDKDDTLFEQGDPPEAFFLLLSGRLKVGQVTPEGRHVIVRYIGPREMAGCVAVCGGLSYPGTAVAVEDSWVLAWSRMAVARLTERYPIIALNVMRIMGSRMQELQQRLREMQTERVERRIAHALARLAGQAGRRSESGVEIDFPLSRQDLAEMTGTTLHTVSRTLSAWEGQGILDLGRQRVTIVKPHAVVAIAGDLGDAA